MVNNNSAFISISVASRAGGGPWTVVWRGRGVAASRRALWSKSVCSASSDFARRRRDDGIQGVGTLMMFLALQTQTLCINMYIGLCTQDTHVHTCPCVHVHVHVHV